MEEVNQKTGVLSKVTLILFFTGYVAVILGVFALHQNWVRGTRGNKLAWTGIILGTLVGTLITGIIMIVAKGQMAP